MNKDQASNGSGATVPSPLETPIPASLFRTHFEDLLHSLNPNAPIFNGFDEEFNHIENKTANDQFFGDYKSALMGVNKSKHRYANVLPPENTRVKLQVLSERDGSDFINANFISGQVPGSEKAYIATQGPLQATFGDFWRMVWEVNAGVVVMLTREVEKGRIKCDKYWPEEDEPLFAGNFEVSLSDVEESTKDELLERKLILTNSETKESRPVSHLQYIAWPDHGVPPTTTAFLSLMDDAYKFNHTQGPIVVHCSAGIGRSGTFCIVHAAVEKVLYDLQQNPTEEPKLNIVKMVLDARSQRPGMIQTKEQYMFVNLTILEKVEEILAKHKEGLNAHHYAK